jgi:hypothetical protein
MSVPCEGYSRKYSTDWKVSGIAFTGNAHTQQIGKFLE